MSECTCAFGCRVGVFGNSITPANPGLPSLLKSGESVTIYACASSDQWIAIAANSNTTMGAGRLFGYCTPPEIFEYMANMTMIGRVGELEVRIPDQPVNDIPNGGTGYFAPQWIASKTATAFATTYKYAELTTAAIVWHTNSPSPCSSVWPFDINDYVGILCAPIRIAPLMVAMSSSRTPAIVVIGTIGGGASLAFTLFGLLAWIVRRTPCPLGNRAPPASQRLLVASI